MPTSSRYLPAIDAVAAYNVLRDGQLLAEFPTDGVSPDERAPAKAQALALTERTAEQGGHLVVEFRLALGERDKLAISVWDSVAGAAPSRPQRRERLSPLAANV